MDKKIEVTRECKGTGFIAAANIPCGRLSIGRTFRNSCLQKYSFANLLPKITAWRCRNKSGVAIEDFGCLPLAMNRHSQKARSCFPSLGLIYRNETFEGCKMLTFQIWRPVMSGA